MSVYLAAAYVCSVLICAAVFLAAIYDYRQRKALVQRIKARGLWRPELRDGQVVLVPVQREGQAPS